MTRLQIDEVPTFAPTLVSASHTIPPPLRVPRPAVNSNYQECERFKPLKSASSSSCCPLLLLSVAAAAAAAAFFRFILGFSVAVFSAFLPLLLLLLLLLLLFSL